MSTPQLSDRRTSPAAHATARDDTRTRLLEGLPVTERRMELAGIPTMLLEGGAGAPVVLLHGPGEHAPKWLRVIPELVASHRVIAPDLPGHGASAPVDGPLASDRVLAWLDELIARTCPAPPALVGQIVGGAIAARFAIDHGDRLDRLVLVDTLGLAPFEPAPEFAQALGAFLAQPDEVHHDGLWRQCAFDLDALRDGMGARWDRLRAYNLERAGAPGVLSAIHALLAQFGMSPIADEALARIGVPTFLIWGRQDLATPVAVAEAASARYGWPLRIIDSCGDDPAIERPEAFLEALRATLR